MKTLQAHPIISWRLLLLPCKKLPVAQPYLLNSWVVKKSASKVENDLWILMATWGVTWEFILCSQCWVDFAGAMRGQQPSFLTCSVFFFFPFHSSQKSVKSFFFPFPLSKAIQYRAERHLEKGLPIWLAKVFLELRNKRNNITTKLKRGQFRRVS